MQTKQSDTRLEEMEAALACPQFPSTDPLTIQRTWTSNESPRMQGLTPCLRIPGRTVSHVSC
jgi:hypothetical protein